MRIYELYRLNWPQELRDIYLPMVMDSDEAKRVNLKSGVTRSQKVGAARGTPEYKQWTVKRAGYLVARGIEIAW